MFLSLLLFLSLFFVPCTCDLKKKDKKNRKQKRQKKTKKKKKRQKKKRKEKKEKKKKYKKRKEKRIQKEKEKRIQKRIQKKRKRKKEYKIKRVKKTDSFSHRQHRTKYTSNQDGKTADGKLKKIDEEDIELRKPTKTTEDIAQDDRSH